MRNMSPGDNLSLDNLSKDLPAWWLLSWDCSLVCFLHTVALSFVLHQTHLTSLLLTLVCSFLDPEPPGEDGDGQRRAALPREGEELDQG